MQGHSESCRKTLEEELTDDPRVKLRRLKGQECCERMLEDQEAKRCEEKEEQCNENRDDMACRLTTATVRQCPRMIAGSLGTGLGLRRSSYVCADSCGTL
jgi:hypothetical protein